MGVFWDSKMLGFLRSIPGRLALVGSMFGLGTVSASAEAVTLPTGVTSAISALEDNGKALIDALSPVLQDLLVAMFVFVALWFIWKVLRRIFGRG